MEPSRRSHQGKPHSSTLSKFDYTYDAAGNILTWQQQADSDAPTLWTYGYDRADQLTSAVHQTTGGTPSLIKRYAYSYDPAGNRTSEQIDDAVTLATHDSLNRLLAHQPGGSLVVTGALNEPGRVTINGVPASVNATNQFQTSVPVTAGTNTVTINAVDASGNATEAVYEVDQAGTGKTFTYDANGNMTSDGTRTFEWDARNQLVAVTVGTHRSEFYYDGLERRVREVEKENGFVQSDAHVLWCDAAICEERASDGVTVTRRLFGHGQEIDGQPRFFTPDHLGSLREVSETTGSLLARYAFDPSGRRAVTAGTDVTTVGFTGHRTQSGGALALALYRGYDPGLGRWLSEDRLGDVDGPNRYAYVGNNPVRLTDPTGEFWVIPIVIGVIAGVLTASTANAPAPGDRTLPSDQGGGTIAGAAAGVAGAAVAQATAQAIVREAMKRCRTRCSIKFEGPDHYFPSMGNRYCSHIRVTCWVDGQKGSTFLNTQIPIPGTCYETKRGQGGR